MTSFVTEARRVRSACIVAPVTDPRVKVIPGDWPDVVADLALASDRRSVLEIIIYYVVLARRVVGRGTAAGSVGTPIELDAVFHWGIIAPSQKIAVRARVAGACSNTNGL